MPGQDQNQEQQQQNETGASGGNGAPDKPAAQAFGTATRAPIGQAPAQQQAAPEGTQQAPAAPRGRGPITIDSLPADALKSRLDRAKQQGQELFFKELGVKTEAEAKAKLAQLKSAEQEAEKRRLAEMGEVERLKAELTSREQRIAQLESQLAEYEQQREHEQQEQVIVRVAQEKIDPDALPLFKLHLAQHVRSIAASNPELAEKFGERSIQRFADKWLQKHPKFAKQAAPAGADATNQQGAKPAAKPAPAPPAIRRTVTTGAPARKPAPPPVQQNGGTSPLMGGKTVRPGQSNSMSSQEVKAFAAKHGISYNPI